MEVNLRAALLTACAFGKVFVDAADDELRGGIIPGTVNYRRLCATQMRAALDNLEEVDE